MVRVYNQIKAQGLDATELNQLAENVDADEGAWAWAWFSAV